MPLINCNILSVHFHAGDGLYQICRGSIKVCAHPKHSQTLCSEYHHVMSHIVNETNRWVYVQVGKAGRPCCWDLYAEEKYKGNYVLLGSGGWNYVNFTIKSLKREQIFKVNQN